MRLNALVGGQGGRQACAGGRAETTFRRADAPLLGVFPLVHIAGVAERGALCEADPRVRHMLVGWLVDGWVRTIRRRVLLAGMRASFRNLP